jgi:amino acid adenylation domain-containing protein/thioester reductase-like protein
MDNIHLALIHQKFEQQVSKTPDAIAVMYQGQALTYQQLNQKSNQLAHYLKSFGVQPDAVIGICIERSLEQIVSILGILKAGAAYLPLDSSYPVERLRFMVEDSQATAVLTQQQLSENFSGTTKNVIVFAEHYTKFSECSVENLPASSNASLDNLAYTIYTSGSTGKPKGVAMPHRALINLLNWQLNNFRSEQAKTLQFTPISFDVSFQEIFSTLCSGGVLVLIDEQTRRNPEALLEYLSQQQIERLFLPFIALQYLAEWATSRPIMPLSLREVITAGEQLKITQSITQWFHQLKDCTLSNQYGPSESHVVTSYTLSGSPNHWLQLPPIGRPIDNTQIYLLNPNQRRKEEPITLVSMGEVGELAIGGECLAKGYINQPELTQSKFIPNPFSDQPEARLYRTGDLVRYGEDGNLEYIERLDDQVKIRGIRIELGEIEATLGLHPVVKNAVVIARESILGQKQLIAYVVPKTKQQSTHKASLDRELRTFMGENLPNCMVPSIFVVMDSLPLTPSGKVDRRELPNPEVSYTEVDEAFIKPGDLLEQKLAEVWKQILGLGSISIHDSFFELGGSSLQSIQLIFRVQEVFQIELPIVALYDAPTIHQFAEFVRAAIESNTKSTSDNTTIAELEADTIIDNAIIPVTTPQSSSLEPENIFITGVTGYLGAFLLHELLEQTQANIHCLVRAENAETGLRKIRANLEKYLPWNNAYNQRIFAVPGDLALPLLGLSHQQFTHLTHEIDVIYHNGAYINLIYPYSALKTANVDGTQELLKLATQIKTKPVHFISTLDVFQNSKLFSDSHITELDELNPADAIHFDGYTKSKWVSEKMITIAGTRGLPVAIYRPAMITGHSKTGVANVNDLMNRLMKGFIQLGSAPVFDMTINIAPVDFFSKGAIYLSRQPESYGKTFNFVNPQPVMMEQFIEIMSDCGSPIKKVGHGEWERLLLNNIKTLDGVVSVLTSKAYETNLSYLERCSVGANTVSCKNVLDGLKGTGILCPPIDRALMSTYFSYFRASGFVDPQKILTPLSI